MEYPACPFKVDPDGFNTLPGRDIKLSEGVAAEDSIGLKAVVVLEIPDCLYKALVIEIRAVSACFHLIAFCQKALDKDRDSLVPHARFQHLAAGNHRPGIFRKKPVFLEIFFQSTVIWVGWSQALKVFKDFPRRDHLFQVELRIYLVDVPLEIPVRIQALRVYLSVIQVITQPEQGICQQHVEICHGFRVGAPGFFYFFFQLLQCGTVIVRGHKAVICRCPDGFQHLGHGLFAGPGRLIIPVPVKGRYCLVGCHAG